MRTLKKLIKTGIFACIFTHVFLPVYLHGETFRNEKEKFSLQYPDEFVPSGVELHNVGLALTAKNSKFPTFNVVIEGGYIDLYASRNVKEKAVLDSYRLVGITDATVVSSEERTLNGRESFITTLTYSLEGLKLRSFVALFSLSDRHYILTFIDEETSFERNVHLAESIVSSFKLETDDNPKKNADATMGGPLPYSGIFLILVVIGLTLHFLRRKHAT